jgi:hypothetical protein
MSKAASALNLNVHERSLHCWFSWRNRYGTSLITEVRLAITLHWVSTTDSKNECMLKALALLAQKWGWTDHKQSSQQTSRVSVSDSGLVNNHPSSFIIWRGYCCISDRLIAHRISEYILLFSGSFAVGMPASTDYRMNVQPSKKKASFGAAESWQNIGSQLFRISWLWDCYKVIKEGRAVEQFGTINMLLFV